MADFMTVADVARYLRISRGQVYRLFSDGLRWTQLGGIRRVSPDDLSLYLEAHKHQEVA